MRLSTLAPTVALAATLVFVTGCGGDPAPQTPTGGSGVEVEDCDAEDRRKSEVPDCGRMVNGRFVAWSWVSAGRSTPPAGWTPAKEPSPTPTPTASPTSADNSNGGTNTNPKTRKTTSKGGGKKR
ncbi:hypothetical protein [Polymorphospora rubra]|uniref:Lipoprotein n=1 Tax=Polymorphospora rubra TaxID=338584 RepID=A0A810MVV2_9ACTN|nr:hypothetical protein [Polymorphospora rubra]BCJ64680.1 hypothetical protein Prubr_17010 [Polymorphospora rubra]